MRVALYLRVSTDDQETGRQLLDLTAYAEKNGHEIVDTFQEKASGAKNDRAERAKVIELARSGGIEAVLVTELSRWGRSTEDLLSTLRDLTEHGVSLIPQTGMQFDLSTPQGKLLLTLLAGFAEFERSLTIERIKSGVRAAQARGVKFGRTRIETADPGKAARIFSMLDAGLTVRDVANRAGVSPTTVQRMNAEPSSWKSKRAQGI